jgi:ribonuclease-3
LASLEELQNLLGYAFRNPDLMQLAMTHPSVCHEAGAMVEHNQRLEFLGDSVLELVLTAELYAQYPGLGEGPLTKARAQLVNRRALAEHSRSLGLGEHLILSRGEDRHGGRERASILADAFEALIGAVFIDGGYEAVRMVIIALFRDRFGQLEGIPRIENPKGELQELLQVATVEPPKYVVSAVSGPDHDRSFECAVYHQGVELGRGKGKSKKAAESEAAHAALEQLRRAKHAPA